MKSNDRSPKIEDSTLNPILQQSEEAAASPWIDIVSAAIDIEELAEAAEAEATLPQGTISNEITQH